MLIDWRSHWRTAQEQALSCCTRQGRVLHATHDCRLQRSFVKETGALRYLLSPSKCMHTVLLRLQISCGKAQTSSLMCGDKYKIRPANSGPQSWMRGPSPIAGCTRFNICCCHSTCLLYIGFRVCGLGIAALIAHGCLQGLGLVFVAVYQRTLKLLYIDQLLAGVKDAFAVQYKPKCFDYPGELCDIITGISAALILDKKSGLPNCCSMAYATHLAARNWEEPLTIWPTAVWYFQAVFK